MDPLDTVSTSGISRSPADDFKVTSLSSPLNGEAGITKVTDELSSAPEDIEESGTPVDLDQETSTWLTEAVSGVSLQTAALCDDPAFSCVSYLYLLTCQSHHMTMTMVSHPGQNQCILFGQ